MRSIKVTAFILILLLMSLPVCGGAQENQKEGQSVYDVITIQAPITPPIAVYITKSIEQAAQDKAQGLIVLLDTPGGLDPAMRDIIKAILNSPIPVIVYVSPSGARAASAGAIIAVAAHVAAMSPGTNIGAAHPVAMGGKMDETMVKKVENDMVAYARSIALKRGHNPEWIEKAVRESSSLTAEEALNQKVIDYLAPNIEQLLEQMDGKKVAVNSGEIAIRSKGAKLNYKEMSLRQKILISISDPNIAYLLLMLGLAGLYFEFSTPGAVIPGIIGGIALILSFFALQTLPVNFAGVLLILFAVILFIAEIKVISHGLLTIGGVISLVLGSLLLFESPDPALRVSLQVMIPAVIIVSLFFVAVIYLAARAQLRKPRTGAQGMIGMNGYAVTDIDQSGKAFVNGEYWNATSKLHLQKGSKITVLKVSGLVIEVEEDKTRLEG
jgi:membrane-bound serine protease (ClpP class)